MNPWDVPRREVPAAAVSLTSLLDVLVILVLFLLAFFGERGPEPTLSSDLALPRSTARATPGGDVHVRVTREALSVDGQVVVPLEPGPAGPRVPAARKEGRLVPELAARLASARAGGPAGDPAATRILLECDQDLSFALLREVMVSARHAGFQDFHFLVLGSGAPGPSPTGAP